MTGATFQRERSYSESGWSWVIGNVVFERCPQKDQAGAYSIKDPPENVPLAKPLCRNPSFHLPDELLQRPERGGEERQQESLPDLKSLRSVVGREQLSPCLIEKAPRQESELFQRHMTLPVSLVKKGHQRDSSNPLPHIKKRNVHGVSLRR